MKRLNYLLAAILVISCLVSCGGNQTNPKPDDVTITVTPVSSAEAVSPTADATPAPTSTPTPTPTPVPKVENTPTPMPVYEEPYIVWATHVQGSGFISEDVRKAIQKCVDEQGIACKVIFLTEADEQYFAFGEEYLQWYEKQKEAGAVPDILQIGIGERAPFAFRFAREKLQPLSEYLYSEEGKSLSDAYTEAEWRKVTIDGEIYTIPVRMDGVTGRGSYLYVKNSEYERFQEIFDGSYQSLRDFCNASAISNPVIATGSLNSSMMIFNNCCEYFGIAAFNIEDNRFFDPTKDAKLRQLAETLYEDVCNGKLVYLAEGEQIPKNAVAYYCSVRLMELQGYTEVVLNQSQNTSPGPGYGIAAESSKKELAFRVLNACYSNPEIASLIDWGYTDVEKWDKCTELVRNPGPYYTIGFIPELSDEQYDLLKESYVNAGNVWSIFVSSPVTGEPIFNEKYADYLEEAFSDEKDYSEVLDVINRKYKEWFAKENGK